MKQFRRPELKSDFEAEPSRADIVAALDAHELWLKGEREGKRLTSQQLPVTVRGLVFDGRNLSRSELQAVDFETCSMRGVNWTEADLTGSIFSDCEFSGDTKFDRATLLLCRFRNCVGVETASFEGAEVESALYEGCDPNHKEP